MRKMLNSLIPSYGRIPLIVAVAWNMTVYFGSRVFPAVGSIMATREGWTGLYPLWP